MTERIILAIFIILGLIVVYRRRSQFIFPFRSNIWLVLFYGLALMSVGWSDYQGVSLRRWIRASGDLLMLLIILTEDDQEEALEHLVRRIAIVLIPLSVVLIRFFRLYGVLYNPHGSPFYVGATTGKNELGLLCAFLGVFLVWRFLKMWPKLNMWDISLFFMLLYLAYRAKSATSNVVLLVGVILLVTLISMKRKIRRTSLLIIAAMLVILAAQWIAINLFGESLTPIFFSATGRDPTFTGRTELWQVLFNFGLQNPILGAGYGSFWLGHMAQLWVRFPWGPVNGHNGFLDSFLDLGLVGLTFLLLLIGQAYRKLLASLGNRGSVYQLFLAFFIMFLAENCTETHIMKPTNFLWCLFLLLAMTVMKKPVGDGEQDLQRPAAIP